LDSLIVRGGAGEQGRQGMVPTTGEVEQEQPEEQPQPAVATVVPAITPKTLRSRSRATGDGNASPSTSPDAATETTAEEAAGRQQQERRGRRGRHKNSDVPLDNRERIKKRVKYLLIKMRVDQNLLDAYSGEGWKGQRYG